jgi:hypothetical protein
MSLRTAAQLASGELQHGVHGRVTKYLLYTTLPVAQHIMHTAGLRNKLHSAGLFLILCSCICVLQAGPEPDVWLQLLERCADDPDC